VEYRALDVLLLLLIHCGAGWQEVELWAHMGQPRFPLAESRAICYDVNRWGGYQISRRLGQAVSRFFVLSHLLAPICHGDKQAPSKFVSVMFTLDMAMLWRSWVCTS